MKTVSQGLACEDIMFEGQVDSAKRINLHYDYVERHYHVIVNLTGATARRYVCKACNKGCRRDVTNVYDQTRSDLWRAPRAPSPQSESPAPNVIDISGTKRVSRTTSRAPRIRKPLVNAGDVALRVGLSWSAETLNVISDIVKSVTRNRCRTSVLYEISEGCFAG